MHYAMAGVVASYDQICNKLRMMKGVQETKSLADLMDGRLLYVVLYLLQNLTENDIIGKIRARTLCTDGLYRFWFTDGALVAERWVTLFLLVNSGQFMQFHVTCQWLVACQTFILTNNVARKVDHVLASLAVYYSWLVDLTHQSFCFI